MCAHTKLIKVNQNGNLNVDNLKKYAVNDLKKSVECVQYFNYMSKR